MRKVFLIMAILMAVTLIVSSCKETLPRRFESFVSSVEKRSDSFSEEDWAKANEKFKKLFNEYKENKSTYSSTEKKAINAAIVRYAKIVVKYKVSGVSDILAWISGQVPALAEGAGALLLELGSVFSTDKE